MVSARVRLLHVAACLGGLLNRRIRYLRYLKLQTKIFIALLAMWGVVRCVVAQTSNQLPTGVAVLRYMLPEHVPSGCVSLQTSIDSDALHIHWSSDVLLTHTKMISKSNFKYSFRVDDHPRNGSPE